jgi:hypothetical protein
MSNYRLFQINQADHIIDAHVVACASDDEATAVAPRYLAGYAAVEVWCDRRRITRLASSPAATTPAAQPVMSA